MFSMTLRVEVRSGGGMISTENPDSRVRPGLPDVEVHEGG